MAKLTDFLQCKAKTFIITPTSTNFDSKIENFFYISTNVVKYELPVMKLLIFNNFK